MYDKINAYVESLFRGAAATAQTDMLKSEIKQNTCDRYDDLLRSGMTAEAAYAAAISEIGDISGLIGHPEATAHQDNAEHGAPATRRSGALTAGSIALYICCAIPSMLLSETAVETLGVVLTLVIAAAATVMILLRNYPERPASDIPAEEYAKPSRTRSSVIVACSVMMYILSVVPLLLLDSIGQDVLGSAILLIVVAAATGLLVYNARTNKPDFLPAGAPAPEPEPTRTIAGRNACRIVGALFGTLAVCGYLAVSFLSGAWEITWVILTGGFAVSNIVCAIISLACMSDERSAN